MVNNIAGDSESIGECSAGACGNNTRGRQFSDPAATFTYNTADFFVDGLYRPHKDAQDGEDEYQVQWVVEVEGEEGFKRGGGHGCVFLFQVRVCFLVLKCSARGRGREGGAVCTRWHVPLMVGVGAGEVMG